MKTRSAFFFVVLFLVMGAFVTAQAEPKGRPREGERLEFENPNQAIFDAWFGPNATAVGQASPGKALVRHKIDEINENLQQVSTILEAAKDAAKVAGFDMTAGTEIDLTDKMQVEADKHKAEDKARFEDVDIDFSVTKAVLSRGEDQTIEGVVYEIWRFYGVMSATMGTQSFDNVADIKVALNVGATNTTRIIEQTMSFGQGSNSIKGVIVFNTSTGAPVSLNLNFEISNEGGDEVFECTDKLDEDSCEGNFSHSFEQTIALAQEFDSEGNDSGKIQWTESGEGGGAPPPPDELFEGNEGPGGPPQGGSSFNNTMNGGWDVTGAGCLEMEQDLDAAFRTGADTSVGGAYCGPFEDGSDKCETYKQGRKYSAILKVEDEGDKLFGNCTRGVCEVAGPLGDADILPPELEHLKEEQGGPGRGFQCGNPSLTNFCDGHCPGLNEAAIAALGAPDPQVAGNNDEVKAWLMGCFEGLMFDDSGVTAGFGDQARKGECWDANGLVLTSSGDYSFTDRDDRIDRKFDHSDNFNNDRAINFEKPADFCQMHFDDTRNVEVIDSTGADFCVPDFHASNNSATAGTPLCSVAGAPSC